MAFPLPPTTSRFPQFSPPFSPRTFRLTVVSAIAAGKKPRRKKKQQQPPPDSDDEQPSSSTSSYQSISAVSAVEKGLRFAFMEELMERARKRNTAGVADAISDMVAAGLTPGPRSFHGLVVSYALNGDIEGAVLHFYQLNSCWICVNSDIWYMSQFVFYYVLWILCPHSDALFQKGA
jgi:hypothetical protein